MALSLGLLVAPAAFLAWLSLRGDHLDEVTVDPVPVVVPAQTEEITGERAVAVALTWDPPRALLAPPWSGTVTRDYASPGAALGSGDLVAAVDRIDRPALATPEPFSRSFGLGDRGADVAMLNQALVRLGYLESPPADPELFDPASRAAVRAWAEGLGVSRPTGVFDRSWVVWLPEEPFPVASVELEVGGAAPPQGTAIVYGPPSLREAQVQALDGSQIDLDPSVSHVLEVRSESLRVDSSTRLVAGESLERLRGLVEPGLERIEGRLRRELPLQVVVVPATAVVTNAQGALCIWVVEGDRYVANSVEVVGGNVGVAEIGSGLAPGAQLLANPAEILDDPRCP